MLRASQVTCLTDTGRQRRDNEDSAYARAPLFVVADGMGGAQAGEVASQLAVQAFEQDLPSGESIEARLSERVREANRAIHERASADREHAGMGTTLTAAYLEGESLVIAHVGDSRAYLLRDGALRRLTRDHSLVEELLERGKLTAEEAAEHPQRSIITRALGPEETVEVDTWTYPVRAGDVLLLCSDGLTSMVSEDAVADILVRARDLDEAGTELIAAANAAGGRDNITVVLFLVEDVSRGAAGGRTEALPTAAHDTAAADTGELTAPGAGMASATATAPARTDSDSTRSRALWPAPAAAPPGHDAASERRARRAPRRGGRLVAALVTILVVGGLVIAGGYLASRQLYFIGTNAQGVVTIYRGFPYDLPLGIHLYETFYVSGVPASAIPSDRRGALLDNHLRSEKDADNVVRALELGKISG